MSRDFLAHNLLSPNTSASHRGKAIEKLHNLAVETEDDKILKILVKAAQLKVQDAKVYMVEGAVSCSEGCEAYIQHKALNTIHYLIAYIPKYRRPKTLEETTRGLQPCLRDTSLSVQAAYIGLSGASARMGCRLALAPLLETAANGVSNPMRRNALNELYSSCAFNEYQSWSSEGRQRIKSVLLEILKNPDEQLQALADSCLQRLAIDEYWLKQIGVYKPNFETKQPTRY